MAHRIHRPASRTRPTRRTRTARHHGPASEGASRQEADRPAGRTLGAEPARPAAPRQTEARHAEPRQPEARHPETRHPETRRPRPPHPRDAGSEPHAPAASPPSRRRAGWRLLPAGWFRRAPGWFRRFRKAAPRWLRRSGSRVREPMGRRERIFLMVAVGVMAVILALEYGSRLGDEPLRRQLEAKMNAQMKGYTVKLGHAHGGPLRLSLTLRDVVIRQQAHPEPPLATIPRLRMKVQWHALLARHLVGDALFDHPRLYLDVDQLHEEKMKQLKLGERGWQASLESVYPLKFDTMTVQEGSLVYIDRDMSHPFEITHWNLSATNIRNLVFPDRTYPSPVHTEGRVFGTGYAVVDGKANFLAEPIPAWQARYRLDKVPLGNFMQFGANSPYELHSGVLSSHGELEYGPRFKQIDVAELLLDGVRLDYVHAGTAEAAARERKDRQAMTEAAKEAEVSKVSMRLDRLLLTNGQVGFLNRATKPPYRLFVDQARLEILNMSNRIASLHAKGAVFRLRGRFMGGGTGKFDATFRPEAPQDYLGAELAIEHAQLPALNDLLRAYQKPAAAGGTLSVYSQLEVKHKQLHGYVKAMFDDLKLDDPQQDKKKPLGARLKEKLVGGLAGVLENKKSDALAFRAEITGTLDAPRTNTSQIFSSIIQNAFWKAIKPGFDSAAGQPAKR